MSKSLSAIILVVSVAMVLVPSGFCVAAGQSSSKIFQSDADFEAFTKTNISTAGTNQGLQLSDDGQGGYQTTGSISYKYSPGGVNNWGAASYSNTNSIAKQNQYLWIAIYKKDYVSQIDAVTGQVENEWKVGVDPSRTVVGLNQDAWVANRSSSDYIGCPNDPRCTESDFSARLNTVSHILPGENKVVTKKVIPGDNQLVYRGLRSISVDSSNRIWVGMYNPPQILVLDGNTFDQPGDVDVIATIPLTRLPYGSVFDKNEENLYVPTSGAGITRINTTTMAVAQYYQNDSDGNALKMYGISNDPHGNVWGASRGSKVITRIDGNTKALKSFAAAFSSPAGYDCTNASGDIISCAPAQIAVTPDDKLFASVQQQGQTIAISQVSNNLPGEDATLGAYSYSAVSACGGDGRGIGYDSSYNIWIAPVARCVARFTKASNYQTSAHFRNTTNELFGANSHSYTYSDFIGNALGNSNTSLKFSYSDKPIDQNNPGVDDPRKLQASADLYIKVDFTGSRSVSPVLRSLTISYDTNFGQRAELLRSTYSDSARTRSEATFEKDQKAYARDEIVGLPAYQNQFTFQENIAGVKKNSLINFKVNGKNLTTAPTIVWSNDNTALITITLVQADLAANGLNQIDYEYNVSP